MIYQVKIATIYHCSLAQAFKTPMLCDVTKVHTGYGLMPKVVYCTEDQNWGQPGSSKKVFVAKSMTQKGGFASMDTVIDRIENKYWKIEVSDFQAWMLGFTKFEGEWETTEMEAGKILVNYTYTLYADTALLHPLNWLFAHTFWKTYMGRVLENIRRMIEQDESYLYE